MRGAVWVESEQGREVIGGAWRRKLVWHLHGEYPRPEAEAVARNIWLASSEAVRVLEVGERPVVEVRFV